MAVDYKNDIYFDPRLGEIYAKLTNGKFQEYNFENSAGKIRHQFIIRPIELLYHTVATTNLNCPAAPDLTGYYDLSTPYGYGGPMIMSVVANRKEELLAGFEKDFRAFCQEHRVVSEFVRFHPIAKNADDFTSIYDTQFFNHTVGINLAEYDDPFQTEFSKSARKTVRRCLRNGLTYEIEEYPDSLNDFAEIYYQTMDRNGADERYYFGAEYFSDFIKLMPETVLKCSVFYEGKTIAMGFYLRSTDTLHTHLSGTMSDFLHLSPAYIMRYALVQWGKNRGYKLIHNGGGTSGDPADSLYLFKKKFSQNTEFDFYLGHKIWNEEIYKILVELTETAETKYFPQYRAEI